jgi:hypothetical protein
VLIRRSSDKHLTGEDLVAIDGGYLTGRRRERVYGHLATCLACQAREREDREFTEMLRQQLRARIDPVMEAEMIARVLAEAARRRQRRRFRGPLLVGAMTMLVLFIMTALPSVSEADSLLGDFVRFGQIEIKERFEDPYPLAVPTTPVIDVDLSALPFDPVLPATLPLGYRLVATELASDDVVNLYFENSEGDSLMLSEGPNIPGAIVVPPDQGDWTTMVGDTPVLVTADPRLDVTGAVVWEEYGIVFVLMTIDEPSGGLPVRDARKIVEVIIVTQHEAVEGAK